jgi:RNA polymerase sigma factor (sigma-70 family)
MIPRVGQELIEAARHGDEQALARLLDDCQPDLRRYARRNCATDDVEEAVQDALLILYRRLGALRTIATFSGWLFKIVRHACLRRLKRRRSDALAEGNEEPLYDATDVEMRVDICRLIAKLPDTYREVVILRNIEGLSAEETAGELGISIEAAKSRLHRGRF